MAVNTIGGTFRASVTRSDNERTRNSISVDRGETSRINSSDTVSVSSTEKQRQQGLATALRSLSNLQSVVDTASSAVGRAEEVLKSSSNIADKIAIEVDPVKRQALAEEGATLIGEIDKIKSDALGQNGQSVVGQGSIRFERSIGTTDDNSSDLVTIVVPDVPISAAGLGLSTITSSTLLSQTEEDKESIDDAIETIGSISGSLKSTESAIASAARKFGAAESKQSQLPTEEEATGLAAKVSKSVTESDLLQQASKLDPLKVSDLLSTAEESDEADKEKTTTATEATP